MTGDDLESLRADVRYARERLDLYRQKMYGSRPTTITRMRELERAHQAAQDRLGQAERDAAAASLRESGVRPPGPPA